MIDFFTGLVCGVCIVALPAFRIFSIYRETIKLREAETMAAASELAKERAIPKKRPRGTPIWPGPRGNA